MHMDGWWFTKHTESRGQEQKSLLGKNTPSSQYNSPTPMTKPPPAQIHPSLPELYSLKLHCFCYSAGENPGVLTLQLPKFFLLNVNYTTAGFTLRIPAHPNLSDLRVAQIWEQCPKIPLHHCAKDFDRWSSRWGTDNDNRIFHIKKKKNRIRTWSQGCH